MTRYEIILNKLAPVMTAEPPVQVEVKKSSNFEFPVFENGGVIKAEDLNHIVDSIKILNNRTLGLKNYNPEERS
jgi:hypothetical protein